MLRDIDLDTDKGLAVAGVGWGCGGVLRQDYLFMTRKVTVLLKSWNVSVKYQKKTWLRALFLSHVHCTIKPNGED